MGSCSSESNSVLDGYSSSGTGMVAMAALDDDDEYEFEHFIREMNPPRVAVDNESCSQTTVVRVDSANECGILLVVVQALADLDLVITKAYITSDGGWFMDVFNITDRDGNKLQDESTINRIEDYIRNSLSAASRYVWPSRRSVAVAPSTSCTSIELTGTDRPGLLSEVSAVLTDLKCNVVDAEIWTHNSRAAAVVRVTDEKTFSAVTDLEQLLRIKERLLFVLKGSNLSHNASTAVSSRSTHTERRLHQMMFDDQDYMEPLDPWPVDDRSSKPRVTLRNWTDKDYSVVTIRCKDRPKLLFDTVCTLTDMKYVVFHANVEGNGSQAYQEFYIRHANGSPVRSEPERQRVIQCLEAAIQRRVSEGLKLELCACDRVGLLSEVTRVFRENSLNVTRAEVTTQGDQAINTFYVCDTTGGAVNPQTIDAIRQGLGLADLQVKGQDELQPSSSHESQASHGTWFPFSGLFTAKSL